MSTAPNPLHVVGIGVAVGSLEALEQLFVAMPEDTGLAFVVAEHLERPVSSRLVDALVHATAIPVNQARDGDRISPNRIYVLPAHSRLVDESGILQVRRSTEPGRGVSGDGILDDFFRTLAEAAGEGAVGVVLSGKGSDGTSGLRALKQRGGFTLVQAPSTATQPERPTCAISAGLADLVCPAQEMPKHLVELGGRGAPPDAALDLDIAKSRETICALLHERTGHDFRAYKQATLARRIKRRAQLSHARTMGDYVGALQSDKREAELLLKDLLIGVTEFFRDPAAFQVISQRVLPELIAGKAAGDGLRIWVPGCSSGQEAYSLAMLLREQLDARADPRPVQIFATDIDSEMLDQARRGRYDDDSLRQVSPERLQRFFVRDRDGYQAGQCLREMCVFSEHNLIRDPPFSGLDLISCRNLLIYLEADLQKKLVPLFHFALAPAGYLFLGPSEGLPGDEPLFETVDKRSRIFRCKAGQRRPAASLPLDWRLARPTGVTPTGAPGAAGTGPAAELTQALQGVLLRDYVPACAVIDGRGEILAWAGRMTRYLEPALGAPSYNLLDETAPAVRSALRTALIQCKQTGRRTVRDDLTLESDGRAIHLRVSVEPLPDALDKGLFVAVVQERGSDGAPAAPGKSDAVRDSAVVRYLEEELLTTRADLQSVVQALAASNEELKASNEELIASNEELQSSKEEIQSINEELQRKLDELAAANADLQNYFASTNIATLFLDRDLRIVKFTPVATELLGLLATDVGRPIAAFAPGFEGHDLLADARAVLAGQAPLAGSEAHSEAQSIEHQVRSKTSKRWFVRRTRPYRTVAGEVAGVVIAFVDVTELRASEERFATVFHAGPAPLAIADAETHRILDVNQAWTRTYGYDKEEAIGRTSLELGIVLSNDGRQQLLDSSLRSGQGEVPEIELFAKDGKPLQLLVRVAAIEIGGRPCVMSASIDITDLRKAEAALRKSEARFAAIHERAPFAIALTSLPEGKVVSVNDAFLSLFEHSREEVLGKTSVDLGIADAQSRGEVARALREEGRVRRMELQRFTKSGERRFILLNADQVEILGQPHVLSTLHDITDRKQAETALRESESLLRSFFDSPGMQRGIVEMDDDDVLFVSVNAAAAELFGLTPEQVKGKRARAIGVAPELIASWIARYRESQDTGRPASFELLRPVGDRHALFSAHAAYLGPGPAGRPRFAYAMLDITERKLQEHRLGKLSRLYAVLTKVNQAIVRSHDEDGLFRDICRIVAEDGQHVLVWIGVLDGRVIRPAAASGSVLDYMQGLRVEIDGELGRGPSGTCVREGRPVVNDDFDVNPATAAWRNRAMAHGLRASAAFPLRRSGKVVGVLTLYATEPGTFDDEQVALLDSLSADVSYALDKIGQAKALEESERSLREADRHKNEFLAVLSHELRNPLAPIRNSLYILGRAEAGSEQAKRAKEVIDRQVEQVSGLVDDLLDVTRIGRGKIQLQLERIDLATLVRQVVEDHRSEFHAAGVGLEVCLTPHPLCVQADAKRIAQVVGNLLQNAAKFTSKGGRVMLSLNQVHPDQAHPDQGHHYRKGGMAVIRVRDTGIGIDAEVLARLFQPFIQADSSLDRSKGGLGLGLALVKGLAELHGGSVAAHSDGLGKGAAFTVRLPLADHPETGVASTTSRVVSARGRVLIIEDNVDAANSLREVIELFGSTVEVAYRGCDGLAKARSFAPDLVLCDIGLPGMDGYEVARSFRADDRLKNIFLVALSGYALPEDLLRSAEAGFARHLAKPPSIEALGQLLAELPSAR